MPLYELKLPPTPNLVKLEESKSASPFEAASAELASATWHLMSWLILDVLARASDPEYRSPENWALGDAIQAIKNLEKEASR